MAWPLAQSSILPLKVVRLENGQRGGCRNARGARLTSAGIVWLNIRSSSGTSGSTSGRSHQSFSGLRRTIAADVLSGARVEFEMFIGRGSGSLPVETPFKRRPKLVFESSLEEARQLGTEHTLRSLNPLRAGLEGGAFNDYKLKSGFGGASLLVRQRGRKPNLMIAGYKGSNPSQLDTVPVWLWILNSIFSGAKSAIQFLWEQPGQLQHIEWPTVNTVARMAVLTLIVVTCLIVLLATVDSTMSFVLASLLRRVP